jgi:hypothetical protein
MTRSRSTLLAATLVLLCFTQASGQDTDPLLTDRPTFTAGPHTVAPGRFQIEMGYTFTESGDADTHNFGEMLARIGILPWLEGRLALNSYILLRSPTDDLNGLQDISVAAKAVVLRRPAGSSAAVPQVALLFGAEIPTGTSGFGANEMQPGVRATLDFNLSDRFVLASNVGWAYLQAEDGRFHQGSGSLVLGYSISGPLFAFVEWYGLFPENRGGGADHYVDGGLVILLGPNFQLDWRIGAGLQNSTPNWYTGAGLSFRL